MTSISKRCARQTAAGSKLNLRLQGPLLLGCAASLLLSACAPEAAAPTVDTIGTVAAELASGFLTQTAGAATATPSPEPDTPTPGVSDTPTGEPTSSEPPARPVIRNFTGCYYGPGPGYELDSNIASGKRVDIVGVGSVAGWYVIINPYFHKECWVAAAELEIDPAMDLSALPVMTPRP